MFQGTLPQKAIKIVGNIVKEWNCDRIYVGCSGNFTIERSISDLVSCGITSNDVTIYSSYIGKFLAGESLEGLKIKEEYDGSCMFLKDYMKSDVEKVATLILAGDILNYDGVDNMYCKRMLRGYEEQYKQMHEKLCEKMKTLKSNVDQFYCGDVMDMLSDIGANSGFISFPPFFKGGYEKMWKKVEEFFEFEEPEYEMFDPKVHIKEFCEKVKAVDNFCIITEREVPELEEYFVGKLATKNNKDIFFYSKTKRVHYVKTGLKETHGKPIIRLGPEEALGDELVITQLSLDQFNELRALYLSTAVTKVANPSMSFGIFYKDKLFGVFAFSNSYMLTGSDKLEKPTIYLMTDFAISPTCEKNLSKLVLYCVLSKEVKLMAEKIMGKRVKTVTTNAFSRNPVSMKYRGIFEQFGRREIEKDEDGKVKKYNLSYGAKMGQWTLKEGYDLWRRKSSK